MQKSAKTKSKELIVPRFSSEREDARWHQQNRRKLEAAALRRIREGDALDLRQMIERAELRPVTIRLPLQDINAAREFAAQKGIRYQTYVRMLLRDALRRESHAR